MLISALAEQGVRVDLPYVARHFLGRSYPVVMAQIRRDFSLDLPPAFEEDYRERLLSAFLRDLRILPGVSTVLDELGLPWCVATSSSPRRAAMSLQLVGLWDRVEGRISTASEVARGKPAPDLFQHAAARMGADPAACLVIEDSLTGIQAARAAGMEVWRFTGGSHMVRPLEPEPDHARPDRHFDRFDAFFDLDPRLRRRG
jgi:HAD superfamily hydrolase (TIGR01509 family)